VFRNLTLRGTAGTLAWYYHRAAVLPQWRLTKADGKWTLWAAIDRADRFQLQQRPLYFTAPRAGGLFCWPVQTLTVGKDSLTATLGPPES
jgi:hypothetical protein